MKYLEDADLTLYHGDSVGVLATLPEASVDCVVTSPPYFGLRDYGYDGQIGLEDTPAAFIDRLVNVFREVRRVLAPHGTCWVNMGDSYAANRSYQVSDSKHQAHDFGASNASRVPEGFKPKDLLGIPWRLAFALQDDGWWLRSDVIWAKPNPMPESVTDRPTKAHEYLFLLTKALRYWWDAEGVREPAQDWSTGGPGTGIKPTDHYGAGNGGNGGLSAIAARYKAGEVPAGRNVRSVWTFPTEPNPEAHFATFPRELVRRCLAAGCPEGGTVLDPFVGSGTTCVVARSMGRRSIGIDLNHDYLEIARRRTQQLSLLGDAA